MKKALISLTEKPKYVSSWADHNTPVFSDFADSARIAEITNSDFPVAPPLFWIDCSDEVTNDQWYYQPSTQSIVQMPEPAARPAAPDQPISKGTTPL